MQSLPVPDEREGIAADAVGHGLDDRGGDGAGQGRIHGVAALEHHAQSGLRGQRLTRRHDVPRQHGHALRGVRKPPIDGRHTPRLPGVLP